MWEAAEGLKTYERRKTKHSDYAIQMGDLTLPGSGPTKGVTKVDVKGKKLESVISLKLTIKSFAENPLLEDEEVKE